MDKMDKKSRQNVIDLDKALKMRANDFTLQEIADSFGVSRQAIQQKLKRYTEKLKREQEKHGD